MHWVRTEFAMRRDLLLLLNVVCTCVINIFKEILIYTRHLIIEIFNIANQDGAQKE